MLEKDEFNEENKPESFSWKENNQETESSEAKEKALLESVEENLKGYKQEVEEYGDGDALDEELKKNPQLAQNLMTKGERIMAGIGTVWAGAATTAVGAVFMSGDGNYWERGTFGKLAIAGIIATASLAISTIRGRWPSLFNSENF